MKIKYVDIISRDRAGLSGIGRNEIEMSLHYKIICSDLLLLCSQNVFESAHIQSVFSSFLLFLSPIVRLDRVKDCKHMKMWRIINKSTCLEVVVPFSLWRNAFLFVQNPRGWTSIISSAVEVGRGLSDSCRFSWRPTVCRHQDPSPSCRSESAVCLH